MVTRVDLRTNDTRNNVLKEAQRLLQIGGYNELSMEKIAETLGLKRPTLYYHFPGGKEQLLVETIKITAAELTTFWTSAIEAGHDTRSRLKNILESVIDFPLFENHRTVLADVAQLGAEVRTTVTQCSEQVFKLLRKVFQEGAEKGEIKPVELELAVYSFLGFYDQVQNLIVVKQNFSELVPFVKEFEQKDLINKMFEIWMGGVEARSSSTL